MARLIKLTPEHKAKMLEQIKKELDKKKTLDGEFEFSVKSANLEDRQCLLSFNKTAWIKFQTLVQFYTTEIGWYGLVKRVSDEAFYVYDILTYPLEVTGVTITSDPDKYNKWQETISDDMFNDMKMHGHSHVNMHTTPSSEDENYRLSVIQQFNPNCKNDQFYIFGIWNKSGECTIDIYDYTNNIHYEDDDVVVSVEMDDGETLEEFLLDTKSKVTERKYTYNYSKPSTTNKTEKSTKKKGEAPKKTDMEKALEKSYFDDDYEDDPWYSRYRGF